MSDKEISNQETAEERVRKFFGKPIHDGEAQILGTESDTSEPIARVLTVRERVLHDAARLIMRDRNQFYGPPAESFEKIAMIMTILTGKQITREDVALFNIVQKMVRNSYVRKEDNSVDSVGYNAILRELEVSPQSQMYSAVIELAGSHEG